MAIYRKGSVTAFYWLTYKNKACYSTAILTGMSIRKQRNSLVGSQPVNISTLFFQNIVTHQPFGTWQQERKGGPPH